MLHLYTNQISLNHFSFKYPRKFDTSAFIKGKKADHKQDFNNKQRYADRKNNIPHVLLSKELKKIFPLAHNIYFLYKNDFYRFGDNSSVPKSTSFHLR